MVLPIFKKVPVWLWVAGAAGVALYVVKKGGLAPAANSIAEGVAAGLAGTVGGVVTGAGSGLVLGIGDGLGVPRTAEDKCRACIAAGDNLGASQYCSAGVFARWQYLSARRKLTGQTFTMNDIFN